MEQAYLKVTGYGILLYKVRFSASQIDLSINALNDNYGHTIDLNLL